VTARTLRRRLTASAAPRLALLLPAALGAGAWLGGGCGARSPIPIPPPAPECSVDADCDGAEDLCNPVFCELLPPTAQPDSGVPAGVCVRLDPIDCDDNDPCTEETCEPATGRCSYGLATFDNDGDGHRAPRPGTLPGAPDACGDDCDDTSALAYPGGVEVCDGFDNDCDGTVDNGSTFVPLGDAIRISGDVDPAGTGGLAWSGLSYAAVYTGTAGGFSVFRSMVDPAGAVLPPGEAVLTPGNGDASGGPILWIGDRYGMAWQDRRSGDYEVYFVLLDELGNKVGVGDQQITFQLGFSINVALAWTGTEFVVVWQDERDGLFNVYAQRVDIDGYPIGSNTALTDNSLGLGNEGPAAAAGLSGIGVAWTVGDALTHLIQFRTFSPELAPVSPILTLTDGSSESVYPTVVWNKDRYVVAWFDRTKSPRAIYAATISEQGELLAPPRAITSPGLFRSRYPYLRSLGDRVLAVYADDRDQNNGYELYSVMISADLEPLGPEQRLTFAQQDSIYPVAAFGPDGNVGILFRDDREGGAHHMYFTRLGCVTTTP
jgi:hypothetical protein